MSIPCPSLPSYVRTRFVQIDNNNLMYCFDRRSVRGGPSLFRGGQTRLRGQTGIAIEQAAFSSLLRLYEPHKTGSYK